VVERTLQRRVVVVLVTGERLRAAEALGVAEVRVGCQERMRETRHVERVVGGLEARLAGWVGGLGYGPT
jgi:hypothetical protein